ncbi:MAG: MFS transporter [Dehalococcoidia bacterium]|nr:MFS transporter [Dehalococcoidia bacterium]
MRVTASVAALRAGRAPRALRAFGYPGYPRLWSAALLLMFSTWMERLAIGWLVLDATDSVFLSALSFAVGIAPAMVLGPIAGAAVDRLERPRLLRATILVRALIVAGIAAVVAAPGEAVWLVLLLVAASGATRTFEIPATQALITDIVPPVDSPHAVGVYSLGMRSVAMLGSLTGGLIIEVAGPVPVFLLSMLLLLTGAWVLSTLRVDRARTVVPLSLLGEVFEGFAVMRRIPAVGVLLTLAVVVEVLAFSYNSLMPAVARDVLDVDAGGLGLLTGAAGAGAILGAVALSTTGGGSHPGRFLLAVSFAFGVFLVLLGATDVFLIALPILAGVGAMAALFDALQWVLLQANVPDEMRGRVLGAWVWAIGFGWIGQLTLGGIGEAFGVQTALGIAGALVILAALLATLASRSLRSAAARSSP